MRVIESKKKKKRKKRKAIEKFIETYWSSLMGSSYAADMVACENTNVKKEASRLKKEKLVGKLKQTDDGFVFVDVSNNFIHGFFPLIDEEGIEKPPYFDDDGVLHFGA